MPWKDIDTVTFPDSSMIERLGQGRARPDTSYGYGIVQAKAAMDYLASSYGASSYCSTSTVSKY